MPSTHLSTMYSLCVSPSLTSASRVHPPLPKIVNTVAHKTAKRLHSEAEKRRVKRLGESITNLKEVIESMGEADLSRRRRKADKMAVVTEATECINRLRREV